MIVEPLPDQQWKLARMFTVSGYRVIGSASLHAARALLRRFPVDLMLLSEDSRPETRAELRELVATFPNVRIVIMGDGQERTAQDVDLTHIAWIRRPARMQDLAELHEVA